MNILFLIAAAILQAGAIRCAIESWENGTYFTPNKKRRNRYAFATLVLSVAALATAAQL